MPARFTPEQLAASAAAGEPRTESTFAGDTRAWHAYQDSFFSAITLGQTLPPVGDSNRRMRCCERPRAGGFLSDPIPGADT